MNIGLLHERLTLETPVRTPDGGGGAIVTWQTVAELWARVRPISGDERLRPRPAHRPRSPTRCGSATAPTSPRPCASARRPHLRDRRRPRGRPPPRPPPMPLRGAQPMKVNVTVAVARQRPAPACTTALRILSAGSARRLERDLARRAAIGRGAAIGRPLRAHRRSRHPPRRPASAPSRRLWGATLVTRARPSARLHANRSARALITRGREGSGSVGSRHLLRRELSACRLTLTLIPATGRGQSARDPHATALVPAAVHLRHAHRRRRPHRPPRRRRASTTTCPRAPTLPYLTFGQSHARDWSTGHRRRQRAHPHAARLVAGQRQEARRTRSWPPSAPRCTTSRSRSPATA